MDDNGELYDERRLAAVDRATAILSGVPLSMDAIAGAAASVTAAPIGVISLVDGEWDRLIGLHGIGGVFALTRRIAVADSLCRTVVASGEPAWLADTAADPTAARAAVVSYLGIGAFAAVPLIGSDGAVVGSVCALDHAPREWTVAQRAALTGVATTAGLLPGVAGMAAELTVNLLDLVPLLDALAESFLVVDGDGAILAWNAAAATTFGWTREEVLGTPLHTLLFPDRDAVTIRAILATLSALPAERRGAVRRRTMWATTKDGRRMPVDASIRAVSGAGGTRICVSLLDASGRFDAEADASRREGLLQAVLNSLGTPVYACDAKGIPLFGNPALLDVMEAKPGSLVEAALRLHEYLFGPDGEPVHPADYPSARALAGEIVRDAPLTFRVPGRPVRRFLANAERIVVGSGAEGAVVALRDVTSASQDRGRRACELAVARLLLRCGYSVEVAQRLVGAIADSQPGARVRLWLAEGTELRLTADSRGTSEQVSGEGRVDTTFTTAAVTFGPGTGIAVPVRGADEVYGVLDAELPDADAEPDVLAAHLSRIAADLGYHIYVHRLG
ncbi:PAS domain-containing protein [Cryptosporangium sp. NPDC048952]|uniref:PAS domain-containing protein n=1 Tax=Cryptosporangium sp. NPDC048952 TaxID=3363961 RepID=UPI003712F06C